jgi:hypothetical protein
LKKLPGAPLLVNFSGVVLTSSKFLEENHFLESTTKPYKSEQFRKVIYFIRLNLQGFILMRRSFKIEYFKDDFERPAILEVFRRVQKCGTFKKKCSNHTIHQRVLISCNSISKFLNIFRFRTLGME